MSVLTEREKEMQMELKGRKIWLVKFPTWKYYQESMEEIKRMARKNDLKILGDNISVDPKLLATNPPKLTPIDGEKPAKKRAPKEKAPSDGETTNGDE